MTLFWKPTLAATLPIDCDLANDVPFPVWASPKYDGMRAVVQGGKLVSRNGIAVPNRTACEGVEKLGLEGYDGELVVGKPTDADVRNRTMSYLMTQGRVETGEVPIIKPVTYFVFDKYHLTDTFEDRQDELAPVSIDKWTKIQVVKQTLVKTTAKLREYEALLVSKGYEGVMLRRAWLHRASQPYMQKRSTLREFELVKWKRWEHGTAIILAVHPLEHNTNKIKTAAGRKQTLKSGIMQDSALFGSATLRDVVTKKEFSVQIPGTKLQAWIRWRNKDWWWVKKVTYKFQPGAKGVPIHPTCAFTELGVK
jgi:DNA ligase-1